MELMSNSPEDMIKNIFSDPSAMEKISGIISALGSTEKKDDREPAASSASFSPEDMIKNIFSDPSAMEKISGIFSALGSTEKKDDGEPAASTASFLGLDNPEMLMKIAGMWGKISKEPDPRVELINAIMPYLNEERTKKAENAIKILKMTKMSTILNELNIFEGL